MFSEGKNSAWIRQMITVTFLVQFDRFCTDLGLEKIQLPILLIHSNHKPSFIASQYIFIHLAVKRSPWKH